MTELLGDPADPRTSFVDTLVNPLIDAFRIALDDHGIAVFDGRGELVAFETDAAGAATGAATGRIVLLGPPPDDTESAVAGLDACLDALVNAYPGDVREARALVDAALEQRLRFLRLGPDLPERRRDHLARHRDAISAGLRDLDIAADPGAALIAAGGRDLGLGLPSFRDFFTSIVHSVPVATPDGLEPMRHLREVYADLYRLDATGVGADLRDCRREILATAWHDTIETLAAHAADRSLGYDVLNDELVKLRSPALRRGSFGISYLGGSGALPWHLTGAAGPKGEVSGDFAVWLASAGYVPVSSALGPSGDQPWFMVPSTAVSEGELDRSSSGGSLCGPADGRGEAVREVQTGFHV